jgi:hypothetical protein
MLLSLYMISTNLYGFTIIFGLHCTLQVANTDTGLINYIDTKAKFRHLKKMTCKGPLRQWLSEFINWRYSQSCWYFRPGFVNCCPSNLRSGSTLPPLPCVKVQYIQKVFGWKRVEGVELWGRGPQTDEPLTGQFL